MEPSFGSRFLEALQNVEKKKFGQFKNEVPCIGQGTWNFPSEPEGMREAQQALIRGIELGMTHIDTAEMYGNGESEEIIGNTISTVKRDDLFIVSKVLPSHATKKGTIEACERSLKRMKTDYLDCYLLHWRGSVPLNETIEGLESLIDQGKILSMGVSNFDVSDLKEDLAIASKPIVCNQILYNLEVRSPERKLIPFCAENDIAVVAYTPFGKKHIGSSKNKNDAAIREIASAHGATVRQIMLAFLSREQVVFTIPKSSNIDHTEQNARAGDIRLAVDELDKIDSAFPLPTKDVPLQML